MDVVHHGGASGGALTGTSRYLQFTVRETTSDSKQTPMREGRDAVLPPVSATTGAHEREGGHPAFALERNKSHGETEYVERSRHQMRYPAQR